MNRLQLAKTLKEEGLADRALSFRLTDERYCLVEEEDKWIICFWERGIETYRREFESEDEACSHAYYLVKKNQ